MYAPIEVLPNPDPNLYTLIFTCPECGKEIDVNVKIDDYDRWRDGTLVQDAFPYLDKSVRELFISGICPKCWDKIFG